MLGIAEALDNEHRVINWVYPSRDKLIEEHAADLVAKLREVADEYPGEPIHFVTHSMGGLVVRAAANHPECPREARQGRAVLLAPPNRGAAFARHWSKNRLMRWYFGEHAGRQLMETPEDGFDYLGHFPSTMRVLVVAGDFGINWKVEGQDDGKVAVEETRLKTPHRFVQIHAGHSWIAWWPTAIRLAEAFLEPAREPARVTAGSLRESQE